MDDKGNAVGLVHTIFRCLGSRPAAQPPTSRRTRPSLGLERHFKTLFSCNRFFGSVASFFCVYDYLLDTSFLKTVPVRGVGISLGKATSFFFFLLFSEETAWALVDCWHTTLLKPLHVVYCLRDVCKGQVYDLVLSISSFYAHATFSLGSIP